MYTLGSPGQKGGCTTFQVAAGYCGGMPVIVIGADTRLGEVAVGALLGRDGEVRAFVSDADVAEGLRARGVKVAIGDVSDGSHVGGAARRCFCAVVIPTAAVDARERSFATTPEEIVAGWASGLRDAGVTRVLWLEDGTGLDHTSVDRAVQEAVAIQAVDRPDDAIAADITRLDATETL